MRAYRDDRPWVRFVAVACLYAGVGLFIQRDLVRSGLATRVYQQNMLGQDCLLHAWTLAWGQHALATLPLCSVGDANVFHPERGTLFYSDHLLGLAVLTAPLRLVTDDALLVHNVLLVAAPVLDALALYALAAYLTGSTAAAVVGGLAYGFAPLRFLADACQIQMTAAWWLPLMLLGGLRAVRGDGVRWALLAGGALLGQGLTGIYLTAFFLPFLALAHVLWWRRWGVTRGLVAWVAAECAAVLVVVPTGLAYRAVQAHLGATRSPFVNAILSLNWSMVADHVPWRTLLVMAALAVLRPWDLPRRLREQRGLFLAIAAGALLFALGPALPLPFGLGTIPGPYRALVELPGFTALRVPARMLHVALLGTSVLAAGAVVVLRQVVWRAPLAATLAAVVALAAELPPHTGGLLPVPPPERIDRAHAWLATQPRTGGVVFLPHDPFGLATATVQFASTRHWQPMLQGMSGVLPPMYPWMSGRLARFPAPDVVTDLRALGVTRAVVRTDLVPEAMRTALADAERARRLLKRRWAAGSTVVFSLRPASRRSAPRDAGRPVPRDGWRATASVAPSLAPRAIDDDVATAWQSWGDLDASVQRAWYHPMSVLDRWQVFLATTPATLTVDLGATVPASAIHVLFGGSDPMVLPEARLDVSVDEVTWTPLPLAPFPDVRALVTRAADAPLAAVPATPRPVRYVRIAVAAYDGHVRDVAVFTR